MTITILATEKTPQYQLQLEADVVTPLDLQERLKDEYDIEVTDQQLYSLIIFDVTSGTLPDGTNVTISLTA